MQTFPTRRLTWTQTPNSKTSNLPPITQTRLGFGVRLSYFSLSVSLHSIKSTSIVKLLGTGGHEEEAEGDRGGS